jgi:ABC-type Co2+ transport system permease subunit
MHIEPGLVDGTKIFLSYATAAAALAYTGKVAFDTAVKDGLAALALRSAIAVALVFCFFEVLPHHPVGVSEVHLILGTTLLLVFGSRPRPSAWRAGCSSRACSSSRRTSRSSA